MIAFNYWHNFQLNNVDIIDQSSQYLVGKLTSQKKFSVLDSGFEIEKRTGLLWDQD